jgi:formylmethanofuran dehydrogenase subunit E
MKIREGDLLKVSSDNNDCFYVMAITCPGCGEVFPEDYSYNVHGDIICEDCYKFYNKMRRGNKDG